MSISFHTRLTKQWRASLATTLCFLGPIACLGGRLFKVDLWTLSLSLSIPKKSQLAQKPTSIWQRIELCVFKSTSKRIVATTFAIFLTPRLSLMLQSYLWCCSSNEEDGWTERSLPPGGSSLTSWWWWTVVKAQSIRCIDRSESLSSWCTICSTSSCCLS